MEFSVEFYETGSGATPVRDFLLELKKNDGDDFAAVVAGLEKLRHRQYHREPLTKAIVASGEGFGRRQEIRRQKIRSLDYGPKQASLGMTVSDY